MSKFETNTNELNKDGLAGQLDNLPEFYGTQLVFHREF